MHPHLRASATALAAAIRRGETTSEEVVAVHVERLRAVNPRLNAVVATRLREAEREAREADRRLAEEGPDGLGPLHGVPCTIKESFELEGMPHTAGLVARRGRRAQRDAVTVRRLRDAGAIPLGVTNVSELLMWVESSNRVYGRSNNPYDSDRIVGGSSGGEGASVGAGIAPFGLGADVGGSIRLPAFFNGVFGHKPSMGLVPNTGQWPIAENEALGYLTTGPIARRAEDLWPLLRVLAGPDGECAACEEVELGDPAGVRVEGLRVLSVPDNGRTPVHPALRRAQSDAADALRVRGAVVREHRFDGLRQSFECWSACMASAGGASFGELLGEGQRISVLRELGRWVLGRSPHTFPALGLAALELVPEVLPDTSARFVDATAALRAELSDALGDDGVMLYPSYSRPAPRHHRPLLRPFDFAYTGIVNVLGFPSTQVPLGLDGEGVPVGVQVVGAHGRDHLTIAVAEALERALGGWTPPPA